MEDGLGVVRFWPQRAAVPGLVWPTSVDRVVDTVRALDARLCVSIADPDRRAAADRHLETVGCPVLRLDIDDIERPAPGCIMPTPAHLATVLAAVRAFARGRPCGRPFPGRHFAFGRGGVVRGGRHVDPCGACF